MSSTDPDARAANDNARAAGRAPDAGPGARVQDEPAETEAQAASAGVDTSELARLVGYPLRRAQLAVFDDFNRTLAPLDLKTAQFSTLLTVARNPGETQTAVAAALGIQRPNFGVLVDELERRGLVARERSDSDRRVQTMQLTEAGAAFLEEALALVHAHNARVTRRLSPTEVETLLDLLDRIAHHDEA